MGLYMIGFFALALVLSTLHRLRQTPAFLKVAFGQPAGSVDRHRKRLAGGRIWPTALGDRGRSADFYAASGLPWWI